MTLGEKIKNARVKAGMTQEDLASKMLVTRQAISKWESDKGIPDIDNLKAMSKLLNISIDYLVDDGTELDMSVTREPVDLTVYGKRRKKVLKDKAIRDKYPHATIMTLIAEQKLTKGEKAVDFAILLLTPLLDMVKLSKQINNVDKEFYLIEQEEQQYLAVVTSEFIESRKLGTKISSKKFAIGDYKFINCGPIKYA